MAGGSDDGRERRNSAGKLTDDILVEILSRATVKSVCRSKCVSKHWHALISDPDHRKKLPQDLAGFFYSVVGGHHPHFISASGTGGRPFIHPSFSFLPKHVHLDVLDSCSGLVLCRFFRTTAPVAPWYLKITGPKTFEYVVVNPATEKWAVVPTTPFSNNLLTVRLGFDPAVSSHFHVFEIDATALQETSSGEEDGCVERVAIYSSQTGVWSHKKSGWEPSVALIYDEFGSVFFNGMLHMVCSGATIAAVDVEGKLWRAIDYPQYKDAPCPNVEPGYISVSQGQLYFAKTDYGRDTGNLAIWALQDYSSGEWTLKQTISYSHLTREKGDMLSVDTVHPECNLMFYCFGDGEDKTLASYDMDTRNVRSLGDLGRNCRVNLVPYVSLFAESFADGKQ